MLALAHEVAPEAELVRAPIETADLPDAAFDLVLSSLALHYAPDWNAVCGSVARWLRPGGTFLFSTEHPIPASRQGDVGWCLAPDGERRHWAVDGDFAEGLREREWLVPGVRTYHRTLATLLNGLLDAGLAIDRVSEGLLPPGRPEYERVPDFLFVRARKGERTS